MKKYIYSGVCLALGLAASGAYALTMTKTLPAKIFYCSGANFTTGTCPMASSGLNPSTLATSTAVDTTLSGENPGIVGAQGQGYQGWTYVLGTLASGQTPDGLAASASSFTLTGDTEGKIIGITVSYVPCGTSSTDNATLSSATNLPGTQLSTTAISVRNTSGTPAACSTGGILYLGLDTTDALDATTGYVVPDTYAGDLSFTVKAVGT